MSLSDPLLAPSRLAALSHLSSLLRGGMNGREVMRAVMDTLPEILPADAYAIWRYQHRDQEWRIVAGRGLSPEYVSHTVAERHDDSLLLDGPFEIPDVFAWTQAQARRAFYEAEGIRSVFVLPLHIRGEAAGTLACYFRERRPIGEDEKQLASVVADIVASAINLRKFDRFAEAARVASADLDLERIVQSVTDAATEMTNAQFGAFFYNVVNEAGESYTLYTISGVPREAFSQFPMPRNTAVFEPTFIGTGTVRSADIRKDPRYGHNPPYHGMPAGHLPVVSYLAVPVVSRSGEVLGGLFFGHAEEGVFTEAEEQIVEALAAQGAVAIDNARLYSAAQAANRAKDDFLATLSHELRTPMTAVLGWARMLKMGLSAGESAEAVDAIERSATVQMQLIEDVLDMSRIMAGKMRIESVPVDLCAVADTALATIRPAAAAKGVEIFTSFPDESAYIVGDEGRLQQIVWNLLTNAVKFTDHGGRVMLRIVPSEQTVCLTVHDTGTGIDPAFLPHVFERFRQQDSSTTRAHGGIGLGLAIVRHLVELHGGRIRAESEGPGRGATFTVDLPALRTHRAAPRHERSTHGLPSLDGISVLVIDDEPMTRDVIAAILRRARADVIAVESADEAHALLDRQRPDIILCDIAMPVHDGYAFIQTLRNRAPDLADLPVIALTAFGRPVDREKALRGGFDAYLKKPVDPTTLAGAIRDLLERRRTP